MPPKRGGDPLRKPVAGHVPEKPLGLLNVRLGVPDVARTKVFVFSLETEKVRVLGKKAFAEDGKKFVQGCPLVTGNIIVLIFSCWVFTGGRKEIGLHDIFDVAKVPAGFAVPIDINWLSLAHGCYPFWNDRRIGAIWILPRAKNVEVAQSGKFKVVATGEHIGVQFVYSLRERIGREWMPDIIFQLREGGFIAVHRTAGGIDKASNFGVPGRERHVQKTRDVAFVCGERVRQRKGNGAGGGMVENVIRAFAGTAAYFRFANIALNEFEALPRNWPYGLADVGEILLLARREVVQAYDPLIQ